MLQKLFSCICAVGVVDMCDGDIPRDRTILSVCVNCHEERDVVVVDRED